MSSPQVLDRRRAGVLLHPTSLPGTDASGHLGATARRFCDLIAEAGFSVWQTLPLNPRDDAGSPYRSASVFAIDTELLDVDACAAIDDAHAEAAAAWRAGAAHSAAFVRALSRGTFYDAYARFIENEAHWLEAYALYQALRDEQRRPWYAWPAPLRDRHADALRDARTRHADALDRTRLGQYLCHVQWLTLREHANARGVRMFGDLSYFVAYDSADVWSRRALFQLDRAGRMTANTGVPPDYFSATGQLWGMPHYDWQAIADTGWQWWIERMQRQLALFDLLRLDHFRGLAAAWQVPPDAEDATAGRWVEGPGMRLIEALTAALGPMPLIAEDLGVITADVDRLRVDAGLPGMRVLQFAFGGDADNPHLPHNYSANTVVYTGTHDNDTLAGWWAQACDEPLRDHADAYLGYPREPAVAALKRRALASVARLAVLPMQDLLELTGEARMNTPGTAEGNWQWRLETLPEDPQFVAHYRGLNAIYGRLADD